MGTVKLETMPPRCKWIVVQTRDKAAQQIKLSQQLEQKSGGTSLNGR